jgi:HEPN domain-containing protein
MKKDAKEEAIRWLTQAEEEFEDATNLTKAGRYYLALFLCQQSAEKALKAFIYLKEEEPIFSHSVAVLLKLAASLDREFKSLSNAKRLDDYYIPTRYPNGLPGGVPSRYFDDPAEAKEAMHLAKSVVELVEKKIKKAKPS